jgi:hypothetical protein
MAEFVTILTKAEKGIPLTAQEADADLIALKNGINNLHAMQGEAALAATTAINSVMASVADAQAQVQAAKDLVAATKDDVENQILDAKNLLAADLVNINTEFTQVHTQLDSLTSTTEDSSARLASLQQTFTNDSLAKATAISALDTRLGASEANIITIQKAQSNLESSTATSLSQLTSAVGANSTSLTNLATTVATNQQATATAMAALDTRVGNAESTLTTLSQSVTTLTSAQNTYFTNMNSRVGATESDLSNLHTTIATQNTANATAFSNLTTTVGEHTTAISNISASINGIEAKWGVAVNNNGRVTGLFLNSGADSKTTFAIQVDKFALVDPTNTEHAVFSYLNGNIMMDAAYVDIVGIVNFINSDNGTGTEIDGARLKTGTVTADNFTSPNYVAPAPVGDGTYTAPTGVKLASIPYATHFHDGSTALVNMEMSTTANFGGHMVGDVLDSTFKRSITFKLPGFYRWTCPTGVNWVNALLVGGGGGGACGGAYASNKVAGCGGGGGGGTTTYVKLRVIPGVTYLIRVGPGGAGGIYGAVTGAYAGQHGYASWIIPEGCQFSYNGTMTFAGANYQHDMGFERLRAASNDNGTSASATQSFLAYTGLTPLTDNSAGNTVDISSELWPLWAISAGGFGAFSRAGAIGGGTCPVGGGSLWGLDAATLAASDAGYGGGRPTPDPATLNKLNQDGENTALLDLVPDGTNWLPIRGGARNTMFGSIYCGGSGACGAQLITSDFITRFQQNSSMLVASHQGGTATTSYGMFGKNMLTSALDPGQGGLQSLGGSGGHSALGTGCEGAFFLDTPAGRVMTPDEKTAFGADPNNWSKGWTEALLVDMVGLTNNVTAMVAHPNGDPYQLHSNNSLVNPGGGGGGGLGFPVADDANNSSSATGSYMGPDGSNITLRLRDGCAGNPGLVTLQW